MSERINPEQREQEAHRKFIVAVDYGRNQDGDWTHGYRLEIDPTNETITKVELGVGWSTTELRQDALQIRSTPKVGDPAPKGWKEWRA